MSQYLSSRFLTLFSLIVFKHNFLSNISHRTTSPSLRAQRGALVCVNQNLMVVISKICILSLSLEFAYERGADRFLGYILCNLITELDAERERAPV